jgi:hypothetical protein
VSERAVEHEAPAAERSASAAAPIAGPAAAAVVERLQRTAGNAAVARLLQRDETAEWYEGGLFGAETIELGVKDDISSKFSVKIRGAWSDPDLSDLQGALGLLTAAEAKLVKDTVFVRVADLASGDAALATVSSDGSSKKVEAADILFGREAGKSGGITVYGHPLATHGLAHECGHVIHYQDPYYENTNAVWKPIYARLAKAGTKISSQPRGDPAKEKNPDEMLAEAFARFHTDPDGLKTADTATHSLFATGKHVKT